MATTYSVGTTGYRADQYQVTAAAYDVPDADLSGNSCAIIGGVAGGYFGGVQYTMKTGDQMLVKQPDGSQRWMKFDAERSTPSNLILLPV
jgi:hypothetical protein